MTLPLLPHADDTPEADRLRATQEDPWVMYLVVRREKPVAVDALLAAGARATVAACRLATDPRYTEAFQVWAARSFRKVTLRATEREWTQLEALPGGVGTVGGIEVVRALPPRLRSQREKLLTKLQALTDVPAGEPVATESTPPEAVVLPFVVNGGVSMRAGKVTAQVGHAVLMAVGMLGPRFPQAFAQWEAAGGPCAVLRAAAGDWTALEAEEPTVVVRDAGLTEVTPGSRTVMALRPAVRSAWSPRLAGLPVLRAADLTATVTDPTGTR